MLTEQKNYDFKKIELKYGGNTGETAHPSRRDGMLFRFKRHDAV